MKKEEMKTKAKEFAQKHEKGLKVAGCAGLVILGSAIGWKACKGFYELYPGNIIIKDKDLVALLESARGTYKDTTNMVVGNLKEPVKMADLGALGEQMMEANCVDGHGFTHFLLLGKGLDK